MRASVGAAVFKRLIQYNKAVNARARGDANTIVVPRGNYKFRSNYTK